MKCAYCGRGGPRYRAPCAEEHAPDARYCTPTCAGLAVIAGIPGEHGTLAE